MAKMKGNKTKLYEEEGLQCKGAHNIGGKEYSGIPLEKV